MSAMTRRKYFHWQIWEIQIWCRSILTTPKISIHRISFLTKEDWGTTYSPKQTLATTHSIYKQVCASCSTFYQFFFYIYGHYINTLSNFSINFLTFTHFFYIYIFSNLSHSLTFSPPHYFNITLHLSLQLPLFCLFLFTPFYYTFVPPLPFHLPSTLTSLIIFPFIFVGF